MPKFNDTQPDPAFWSTRRLLTELGSFIPADPASTPYRAMATLWARHVERQTTFKRAKSHKPRSRRLRPAPEIIERLQQQSEPEASEWIDIEGNNRKFDVAEAERKAREEARAAANQAAFDNSVWAKLLSNSDQPE